MTKFTKGINVTSIDAGATAFEITSTEEEKKKAVKLHVTAAITQRTTLTTWLEREKVSDDIPIEILGLISQGYDIPLDIDIPVGQTLKGILTPQVAATHGLLHGWIEYEIL